MPQVRAGAAALLAVAALALFAPALHAQRSGPFGPSPAGKALLLFAEESADGETLAPVVLEAASRRWTYRLFPRLLDVLEEWVREDRARLSLVRDAFGRAATAVRSETAAAALVDAAEELRQRLARARSARSPREGWLRPREGDGVPIPWAAAGLSPRDLARRRVAWVDARLPKGSRTAYVTAAFEAFLATSCGAFLGGGDLETCRGVGLLPLRRAALEAALAGLSGDGTEPGLAGTYLAVDPDLTTRALDEAAYRFGDARRDDCSLLRAWLRRPPTRWQVRAALEPPLEP